MIATTNLFQDSTFRRHLMAIHNDEAIALLEGWGVKYVLLDEIRKPMVQDSFYVRHQLYAHKFPYIPDPVTDAYYGDADWNWKGTEKIDYTQHGAETKETRNDFRSLWSSAVREAAGTSAVKASKLAPS
ncbi:hypothetical protein TraAM80_08547 [Trypanosoma rangeli]|uniref:Uncharacterized protein n=1 Tax=Trypanosoma rangeli TaxID=5698 RepID=A0A3R7MA27_TRYRA|nr:uncharacterized protein TraAM80_08547 [Trypanosoma rangeli]RNE98908.1 hypothetical protein TraAM80_08547 [Trypanosoma rangeli]|eukprot:RNE98908.1 hypothetical protein TraAM80_08547 [Trypanosoma rangeli]